MFLIFDVLGQQQYSSRRPRGLWQYHTIVFHLPDQAGIDTFLTPDEAWLSVAVDHYSTTTSEVLPMLVNIGN